jgi:hypothetical protein
MLNVCMTKQLTSELLISLSLFFKSDLIILLLSLALTKALLRVDLPRVLDLLPADDFGAELSDSTALEFLTKAFSVGGSSNGFRLRTRI